MRKLIQHKAVLLCVWVSAFGCGAQGPVSQSSDQNNLTLEEPKKGPPASSPPTRRPANMTFDVFQDVARPVGIQVDGTYQRYRELLVTRSPQSSIYPSDSCEARLDGRDTFADRIAFFVAELSKSHRSQLSYVRTPFDLPNDVKLMRSTSLISHELCEVTSTSLQDTYRGKKIPNQTVIKKMNLFSSKLNQYRKQYLLGDVQGLVKAGQLWSKMFMCLSYVESLTTADTNRSRAVAESNGVRKPAGVKYYMDPLQVNPASKFNIGLFQFSPSAEGGIQACIREWNLRYNQCSIATNSSWKSMTLVLGAPLQTFNSFCGVYRVASMFGLQVNTTSRDHTHPANFLSGGKLRPAEQRCVSPFMNTAKSYNHFGPLQNSTTKNLDELLSCTLKGE